MELNKYHNEHLHYLWPVDYNYQHMFILKASSSSGIYEPMRYYQALNTVYRTKTWSGGDGPNTSKGFRIRVMGPWFVYGMTFRRNFEGFDEEEFPNLLNGFSSGLRTRITNAHLRQFVTAVEDGEADTDGNLYNEGENKLYNKNGSIYWNRYTNIGDASNKLEPKDIRESEIRKGNDIFKTNAVGHWVDQFYYLIPKFYDLGVDHNIMTRLINWCDAAWPLINWNALRQELSVPDGINGSKIYLSYNSNFQSLTVNGLTNGTSNFVIYDLFGRAYSNRRIPITRNKTTIDIQNLTSGVYVIRIKGSNGKVTALQFHKK